MQENQKKKKFSEQFGANMSFDVIAAVQKTTSVGLFLTLPQATHSKYKLMPPYMGRGVYRLILGG